RMRQLHPRAQRHLPQMRHVRGYKRVFVSGVNSADLPGALNGKKKMIENDEEIEFIANLFWNGDAYRAVWAVRRGQHITDYNSLMSSNKSYARDEIKREAARLGYAVRWESKLW